MKSRKNNTPFFNLYQQYIPDFVIHNQPDFRPQNPQNPQIPQYRIPQYNFLQFPTHLQYPNPPVNQPNLNPVNNKLSKSNLYRI